MLIFTGTSFSPYGLMAQQPFEQWLSPHAAQAHYKQGRSITDADGNVYQAVQASVDIYSASMNSTESERPEGFMLIIEPNTRSLMHSTYFGGTGGWGLPFTSINTVAVNNFNEMFGFGWSRAAYVNGGVGIPVKNNGVPNSYFQIDKNGIGNNYDAIGFLLCYDGTVLNVGDELKSTKSHEICHVYPNLVSRTGAQYINFECPSLVMAYSIYSIDGKLLQSRSISADSSGLIPLSPGQLKPGVYLIALETVQGKNAVKLVISE